MIIGRLTSPATCWAAALDFTRAEKRTTIASVEREERRDDPDHQHPPGRRREEPSADLGADDEVHDQRVQTEAHDGRQVPRQQARDELAEVDLLERGGGVGEELSGTPLALTDDRGGSDCRRDCQRHDDGDRSEQVHRERVRGAGRVGGATDRVLCLLRQQVERLADLLHRLDVSDAGDREQQHEGDEHEEDAPEDDHRPPEVAGLGELSQVCPPRSSSPGTS